MRGRIMPESIEARVCLAQARLVLLLFTPFRLTCGEKGLDSCRCSMEARGVEYLDEARQLGVPALAAKRAGNRVLGRWGERGCSSGGG